MDRMYFEADVTIDGNTATWEDICNPNDPDSQMPTKWFLEQGGRIAVLRYKPQNVMHYTVIETFRYDPRDWEGWEDFVHYIWSNFKISK